MNVGTAQSGGLKGAGTYQIFVGKGVISAVHAVSDGTNVATVTLYDNASGDTSGNVLAKINGSVTTGSNGAIWTTPIRCDVGLTMVVSGTGTPQGIVYFGA
jgi:hypothetical protein